MNRIRLLILCFILALCASFASCAESDRLEPPTGVTVEYETLTLKWKRSEGAVTYTVRIEPEIGESKEITVSKTQYSLNDLAVGKYTLSVYAGDNGAVEGNSPLSARVEFEREEEPGLDFRLVGGEYEVLGRTGAGDVINIPATYRKKPVTSIAEKAFFNATDIKAVNMPDTLKKIGDFAFSGSVSLESVILPSELCLLGESAFLGCSSLSGEIVFPEGIKAIPNGAFADCSKISALSFGTELEFIGEKAFSDCSALTSLKFPESLRTIGPRAFAACSKVASVTFREGITEIGDYSFSKGLALTSVALPDSLSLIGEGAFYYCSSLTEVTFGNGISEIEKFAFYDTPLYKGGDTNEIYVGNWLLSLKDASATEISVKPGTVGIANGALEGNANITSVILPDSVKLIGKRAFAGSALDSAVIGSGVTHIADEAFAGASKLTNVYLGSFDPLSASGGIKESSLIFIGSYAFMGCRYLERIEIPDSVKDIGSYSFRNTGIYQSTPSGVVYADGWVVDYVKSASEDVIINPGTVGIARYSFYNCSSIKSVMIPGSVKLIGKGAFYGCSSLERATLPDELTKIEDYTFWGCVSYMPKSLPPRLKEIGRSAFYMCASSAALSDDTESDTLEIPSGVTRIGDYAFFGSGYRSADAISEKTQSSGIDILVIGEATEYIGKCAFYGFNSLKSVILKGSADIGEKAFYKCLSLENVKVEGSVSTVGSMAFYKCPSLTSVSFTDSLTEIGSKAFYKCEKLSKISLGASLKKIEDKAFSGSSALLAIYLPESVEYVGREAFRGCDSLGSVTLGASVNFIGAHAFYSCDKLTVYSREIAPGAEWNTRWNSTFCPVVWVDTLSGSGYVTSITAGNTLNIFPHTVISAPSCEGYTFRGYSLTEGGEVKYSSEEIALISGNSTLYAIWQ